MMAQKEKYESGNVAKKFLHQVSEQIKNFITETTPLNMDGIPCCFHNDCQKVSIGYGVVGEDFTSCSEHKKANHVNLSKKGLCVYKGCKTRGHVTIEGCSENFCTPHAESLVGQGLPKEFVHWTKNTNFCSADGCQVTASYDNGRYCKTHSPTKVSDETRTCEFDGCSLRPTFGTRGDKKTRCKEHKEDGMYFRKLCDHADGCELSASYGLPGEVATRCLRHREEGYVLRVVETKCAMACCMYGEGVIANFFHPDHKDKGSDFFEKRICSFARRILIEDALMACKNEEVKSLLEHFGLKEVVTLTSEGAFRVECEKYYYKLLEDCSQTFFDKSVVGEAKSLGNKRPDIFYKWQVQDLGFGIHIEYDEDSNHEDDTPRLERIAKEAGCEGRTYVIRVQGGHDTHNSVCKVVQEEYYEYWEVTGAGKEVCRDVANVVKERIAWIQQGLAPDFTRPAKYVVQ
ncbi:unnamed protein product [Sphacelaria rigidula]